MGQRVVSSGCLLSRETSCKKSRALNASEAMIAVRNLIKEGTIGEIVDIDHRLVGTQPWNLWPFLFPKSRVEINYHSIHYIDNIRSLVGDPTSVYCKTMTMVVPR